MRIVVALVLCPLVLRVLVGCAEPRPLAHRPAEGALGPYSGSTAYGELLFLSGKVGPPGGSFEDEVAGALAAVEAELAASGATLADLLFVSVYLVDVDDYATLNAVYAQRVPPPWPARATVVVAALPGGRRVEIAALARRPPPPPERVASSSD